MFFDRGLLAMGNVSVFAQSKLRCTAVERFRLTLHCYVCTSYSLSQSSGSCTGKAGTTCYYSTLAGTLHMMLHMVAQGAVRTAFLGDCGHLHQSVLLG